MNYEDLWLNYEDGQGFDLSAAGDRTGPIPYSIVSQIRERTSVWNAEELGQLLGLTGKHIYRLAKNGRMPSYRLGGAVRFDPQAVADWLEQKATG